MTNDTLDHMPLYVGNVSRRIPSSAQSKEIEERLHSALGQAMHGHTIENIDKVAYFA